VTDASSFASDAGVAHGLRVRCRFHGGKSTGPKTQAGRARIAEAQRLRWLAYRERVRAVRSGDETGSERYYLLVRTRLVTS
jgi:hypothetical protein